MKEKCRVRESLLVAIVLLVCLGGISWANSNPTLHVTLELDPGQQVLNLTETATIQVLGFLSYGTLGNGLVGWELGLEVDNDGIVSVLPPPTYYDLVPAALHFPTTDDINVGKTGQISLANTAFSSTSDAGTAGTMLLAEVTVQALAVGTVDYTVGLASSGLFQGLQPGPLPVPGVQDLGQWDGTITVVPEPISLVTMLVGAALVAARRRR